MAGPTTTTTTFEQQQPPRPHEHHEKSSLVVVELDEPQPAIAIRRLRKGKGKLYRHIENVVQDLTERGTVKAGAQPLVIVVEMAPSFPWAMDDD